MKVKRKVYNYILPSQNPQTRKLAEDIIHLLEDKKMQDIKLLNLEKVNPYFCFFIIASANSSLQLKTIAREIHRYFGQYLDQKRAKSDDVDSGWIIYDFIDIVLHLFMPEQRTYYNLEKLWGDAEIIYTSETKKFQWLK
jgi:ribosome-associated protein